MSTPATIMAPCGGAGRRVVLFPFPYQGHLSPMLRLAAALHERGVPVTVLQTQLRALDPADHPAGYRFVSLPPVDLQPEIVASEDVARFVMTLNTRCAAPFNDRLSALIAEGEASGGGGVRCIIADVLWFSAQAAASELGVPALALMTSSAASFRTYMAYPILLEKGYLPVKESQKDAPVHELPPFRVKDIQRIDTSSLDEFAGLLGHMVAGTRRSSGLILNTFDSLEGGEVAAIREDLAVPAFAVGPLNKFSPSVSSSLLPPDRSCLDWLDARPPRSVVYASLGSLSALDAHEFTELAEGLAGSGRPFLLVARPSLVRGGGGEELPSELEAAVAAGQGKVVPWAPQEEVLGHPAVGAFLTHSGWNSTVESVSEGVPMLCRACFGDQLGTARYACDVWRVAIEVEEGGGGLERGKIGAAITRLMDEEEGGEVRERMKGLKEAVDRCVVEGGSSHTALMKLVDFVMSL